MWILISYLVIFINCIYCQSEYTSMSSWTKHPHTRRVGGHLVEKYTNLLDCISYCEFVELSCIAVEFKPNTVPPECWYHPPTTDLSDAYSDGPDTIDLYIIQRNNTQSFKDVSNIIWTSFAATHSTGGQIQSNYWTLLDCFFICRTNAPSCVAIDYDVTTQPPCWLHFNADDLIPNNTYSNENTTQIRFTQTSTPPTDDNTFVQCAGKSFPPKQLCDGTDELHITGTYYKINLFCCEVIDGIPPDISTDSSGLYPIYFFNSVYDDEIRSKCNASGCFNLMANGYTITNVQNDYCSPESQTNMVVIKYQCHPSGYSEGSSLSTTPYVTPTPRSSSAQTANREFPSTTIITSSVNMPGDNESGNATNQQKTTPTPPLTSTLTVAGGQPIAAPSPSPTNNTALIVGLVVGLGGAAIILAIIIIIICCVLCTKKRKEEKVEAPPGNNPVYFTYTPEVDANPYSELPDNTAGSPNNAYAVYELIPNKSVLTENENNDKLSNRGTVKLP